jgi:hypothetical protein
MEFFFRSDPFPEDIGMHVGRTVFSQLMDFVPYKEFLSIVKHHRGEYRVRHFSCWEQFLTMAFDQSTEKRRMPVRAE